NGSRRWIRLPGFPFTLQPSEIARVTAVLWVAHRSTLLGEDIRDLRRGFLPMLGLGGLFSLLILLEPDFGATILFLICYVGTLLLSGARMKHLLATMAAGLGAMLLLGGTVFGYVRDRVSIWLGESSNDQVQRAIEAIGSGDGTGVGLAQGGFRNQSLQYMQTDYVFAQVGEEFGLMGSLLVLGLFLALLIVGFRMAAGIRNRYSAVVAYGLVASVVLQALLHIQIVTGFAPPKGMNLPFVSDGGSALLATCLAVGIALGAARGNGVPAGDSIPVSALNK
ncbi:MAG: FtsW/RodA/SpoVE family cell cycle protein, partial [Planctomycetes bacterium]|nr:FtsW/RodA/SpoVE family cell cycle protein [Planctomycetota bacterium]